MNGKNARTRLILQLERIIASQCHQKNLMGGKKYRYPVQYVRDGTSYKCSGNGTANVNDSGIKTMKYQFGSHTLDIGIALDEILDFIEKNCEINNMGMFYYDEETEDRDDLDQEDYDVFW